MDEDKSAILTLNEQKVFDHGYAMGKAEAYEKAFHLLVEVFGQAKDNQFLCSLLQREEKTHDSD